MLRSSANRFSSRCPSSPLPLPSTNFISFLHKVSLLHRPSSQPSYFSSSTSCINLKPWMVNFVLKFEFMPLSSQKAPQLRGMYLKSLGPALAGLPQAGFITAEVKPVRMAPSYRHAYFCCIRKTVTRDDFGFKRDCFNARNNLFLPLLHTLCRCHVCFLCCRCCNKFLDAFLH